jgi:hypothetical protein
VVKETISVQTFINDLGIGNNTITPPDSRPAGLDEVLCITSI